MKLIDENNLKRIELDLLKEIRDICVAQNINYSLCGGTLLGAVRHKGFIPWDDDIDIFMVRKDYDKFIDFCINNETPFKLICNKVNQKYGYLFAKVYSEQTVIREEDTYTNDFNIGVFVDIFPIDFLGDTFDKAKKHLHKTRFKRELLVACNWKNFFRSKTRAWYHEPIRYIFYILSRFFSSTNIINSIEKKYLKNKTAYSGCICGSYRNKEILPSYIFEKYITIDFEGEPFSCIENYDAYLSSIYGDYMQLPPEEKRISHHMFTAFYIDK